MKFSLKFVLLLVLVVAVSCQFVLSKREISILNNEVRQLEKNNRDLRSKLDELLPIAYESVVRQFVEQAESQLGTQVRVTKIRYRTSLDHYYLQFQFVDDVASVGVIAETELKRVSSTEFTMETWRLRPGGRSVKALIRYNEL